MVQPILRRFFFLLFLPTLTFASGIYNPGSGSGGGGGGPNGNIVASPQYQIPNYSYVGSSNVLTGTPNLTNNGSTVTIFNVSTFTQGNVSTQTATGVDFNYTGSTLSASVLTAASATVTGSFFSVGGSTLVVTNGNVGIDTATPTDTLSMFNPTSGDTMYIGNLGCGAGGYWGINFSADNCSTYAFLGSASQTFFNTPNFGVADLEFRVANISYVEMGSNGMSVNGTANTAPPYPFSVAPSYAGATSLMVNFSGEVGIGTTNPGTKMQMSSGTLTIDGNSGGINVTAPSGILDTYGLSAGSMTGAGLSSCSGASNALTWNSSTNLFGCNTISSSGGGGWTLGVGTGSASGYSGTITSSPTYVMLFDSNTFKGTLEGSATAFIQINPSSVTLQGSVVSSITLASMYGAPTLVGTNFTSLPGGQVGSGVPAANIAAGSLGSSVIASSITLAAMYGAPTLVGTNFTALPGAQVGSGVPAANIASGSLGSSVIASSITLAAMYGSPTLNGANISNIQGANVGSGVPAANIASGSLGSSVIASSITLAAMYGAPTLTGTNITSIPAASINSGTLGASVIASSGSSAAFIINQNTLQSGATFYVSSGTVKTQFNLMDSGQIYTEYVSTSFALSASSTATNGTSNMTLPGMGWFLPASETWAFQCFIQMTGATGGIKLGINGPTSSTVGSMVYGLTSTATTFTAIAANTLNTVDGTAVCTASTCPGINFDGWIKSSSTAGEATIVWQAGIGGDSVTLNAGSWCLAKRVL